MFDGAQNPVRVQFVPLHQETTSPTPLVLVHDGGGTVFSYFILGSLDRDVWAIFKPKYSDGEPWEGGMDEMAGHYIGLLVEAGIRGPVVLGGWSLGGLLSLAMARMLAQDPSTSLSIAGILLIDSPYHMAHATLTRSFSEPIAEGMTDLLRKSFENCEDMLKTWNLPSWEGPLGGGKEVRCRVAGRTFALRPGSVLYKAPGEDWTAVDTRQFRHEGAAQDGVSPPPAVLIRCTRPAQTMPCSGPEPALIDLHRDETLLGWEGNYPDFIRAVIDVDDDHYRVFDKYDEHKTQTLTSHVRSGLAILSSLSGPRHDDLRRGADSGADD